MKKTMIMKIFGVMVIALMLVFVSTYVLAAEDDFTDLLNNDTSTNSADDEDDFGEIGDSNDTNTNNTNTNNANTNNANPLTTNGLGTNNNTNNANSYDNTNLPSTGIQDSIPTVLLIVVFGVSAVYAYKKIKDYQQL